MASQARIYAGQMIEYRIRLAPGFHARWLTEISHVSAGDYFVDEQRQGPYRLWHHEHHFIPTDGGVEMKDKVTYALGFGPLGEAVHAIWVRGQLETIFKYRQKRVREIFG